MTLTFAKNFHCNDVEEEDDNEENGDPDSVVYRRFPVTQENSTSGCFGCYEDGIGVPVVPSCSKSQTGVDESLDEVGDGDSIHR